MSGLQQAKPSSTSGDSGDDFTNNFISDLGPLLALFGEQVAKQFMSQSMGWADNIIFAMGPLGIITAIVGAIRVGGPSWLKAIIGRARENRAVAEVELMSSTSHEVCELWNGQQIVRIMGSPEIRELIYINGKGEVPSDGTVLYTLDHAVNEEKIKKTRILNMTPKVKKPVENLESPSENGASKPAAAGAPNISLNIHNRSGRGELHVVAVIGTALQSCVLVYGGLATYHPRLKFQKEDSSVAPYAFPLTSVGTFFLVVGMLICSYIIEHSTKEESYQVEGEDAHILWLQKVATVGDQEFDSYAIFAKDKRNLITTSRRNNDSDSSDPEKHDSSTSSEFLASVGTMISLCGFITQFIGLRGMHWSVTATQLGVTFIMTIFRAWVRRGLAKRPYVQLLPSTHEIDWLATRVAQHEDQLWRRSEHSPLSFWHRAWEKICMRPAAPKPKEEEGFWALGCFGWSIITGEDISGYKPLSDSTPGEGITRAHEVVQVRKDLGWLTKWPGPGSNYATSVATAIELVMDILFKSSNIDSDELFWTMNAPRGELIWFKLKRTERGGWGADLSEIEAALSLWLYAVRENEQATYIDHGSKSTWLRTGVASRQKSLRLLGESTESTLRDMRWWMGSGVSSILQVEVLPIIENSSDMDSADTISFECHRVVGFRGGQNTVDKAIDYQNRKTRRYKTQQFPKNFSSSQKTAADSTKTEITESSKPQETHLSLAAISDAPLGLLFAQDMFSAFMWAVANFEDQTILETFGPATVQQATDRAPIDSTTWQSFTLKNPTLLRIVQGVQRTGLGSLEEIYMSVIPPLSARNKLPEAGAVVEYAREEAKKQEYAGNWSEARKVYLWAFQISMTFGSDNIVAIKAAIAMAELIRSISIIKGERRNQRRAVETAKDLENLQRILSGELKRYTNEGVLSNLATIYEMQGRSEGCDNWKPLVQVPANDNINFRLFKRTPLHEAILNKDEDEYQKLIAERQHLDAKDILGWTPLHYAVHRGDKDAVSKLLEGRARLNSTDNAGWTPLHYASWTLGVEADVGRLLLRDRTVEVDVQGRDGFTPLHCASRQNKVQMAKELIKSRAKKVVLDNTRRTPLHWAAYSGSTDIVRHLLKQGEYLDLPDEYRRTPLHLAASRGHDALVRMFLGAGVDQEVKDQDGLTAVHLAARECHEVVVKAFLEGGTGIKDPAGRTALHMASEGGHISLVKELLGSGVDKKARDRDGRTALHDAADHGHEAVVKVLLKEGVDEGVKDKDGLTALYRAAIEGHKTTVRILLHVEKETRPRDRWPALHWASGNGYEVAVKTILDSGEDLSVRDQHGSTALHKAAENGHEVVVKTLLGKGADLSAEDQRGSTALHKAVGNGHKALVKTLIDKGADISAKDKRGSTVLHKAAENGHEVLVKILLENGADISAKDQSGSTALHKAAGGGHEVLVETLLKKGADISVKDQRGSTALHKAAGGGHEILVETLLKKGADISEKDQRGSTVLHKAAENGHEELVEVFLGRGLDISAKDQQGRTALHKAAHNGHKTLVKILIERGAEISAKDYRGSTALHKAAENECETKAAAVIATLLENGASISLKDKRGSTALHKAAFNGHEALVKTLLRKGADISVMDQRGSTPLYEAAYNGHETVVKTLLESGADISAKDYQGRTALHEAAYNGHETVVKTLLEKGIDVVVRDQHWSTALHLAAYSGHEAVVKVLLEAGVDMGLKDRDGFTPLELAGNGGHSMVIKTLSEVGADN